MSISKSIIVFCTFVKVFLSIARRLINTKALAVISTIYIVTFLVTFRHFLSQFPKFPNFCFSSSYNTLRSILTLVKYINFTGNLHFPTCLATSGVNRIVIQAEPRCYFSFFILIVSLTHFDLRHRNLSLFYHCYLSKRVGIFVQRASYLMNMATKATLSLIISVRHCIFFHIWPT